MQTATSEVEVVNMALRQIDIDSLLSLSDTGKTARVCRTFWPVVRDTVMRSFYWNFATKRDLLSEVLPAPAWGHAHSYPKPADMLRLIEINEDREIPWRIEGGFIVTDISSPIQVRYIRRELDVGLWDPDFITAVAARMALMLCRPLARDQQVKEDAKEHWQQAIQEAVSVDSTEQTPEIVDAVGWVEARFTTHTRRIAVIP